MIEQEKTFKQKVNEFLCKYAQSDYVDEYGNIIRKPDGRPYKSGRVTGWDVFVTFIFKPLLILAICFALISCIGITMGNIIYRRFGITIDIFWFIDPFVKGMTIIGGMVLIIAIFGIIYKLSIKEVAKCPLVEIPPERKKCSSCTAPLPYENEEIKVSIKNEIYGRRDLGKCEICGAPKLYDGENYTIDIKGYFKQKTGEIFTF